MSQQQDGSDQYEVIIVECCQNCETHQTFSRHSQWKYFEQFNQLKRKLERFVNNTIVVKNPIPDELSKPAEARLPANTYLNKQSNEIVTFPRVGAFQIYIYNVLIYSKLLTNNWPNHYKLIQIVTKIIQEKKKGNNLEDFSVFRQEGLPQDRHEQIQKPPTKEIKEIKQPNISKKKKKDYRVYKSKDKTFLHQSPPSKKQSLEPLKEPIKELLNAGSITKKQGRRTLLDNNKEIPQNRVIETKNEARVKLPSLRNTISFKQRQQQDKNQSSIERIKKLNKSNKSRQDGLPEEKQQSLKKIFNSIEEFEKSDLSVIHRKQSNMDDHNFTSLVLDKNESIDDKEKQDEDIKMLEDRSVQYSEVGPQRDFMNRSIQYEEDEDFHCDYGLQIDDGTLPKQKNSHYVQTDQVEFSTGEKPKKPYMLDEQTEANIIIPKDQKENETQTIIKQYIQVETNTEMKAVINRGYQFPEEQPKPLPKDQFNVIDSAYTHLFQKRRNIPDNNYFSIDKFEEKATRYKWIGRAQEKITVEEIRRSFLFQCLVFCFYNYFGIKTPEKRLSFQACSNVVIQQKTSKISNTSLIHIMTADNPEIQYFNQFEQYEDQQMKYPLSEILTFKNSKQKIKFANYGGFLALAYFIGDKQIYQKDKCCIGVVVSNEEVKQIIKLVADGYELPQGPFHKSRVNVEKLREGRQGVITLERASQQIQTQFIATLTKIVDPQIFDELMKYYEETFIHLSPSHKTFRNSLISMKTDQVDSKIVDQFMEMLKKQRQLILQNYKGQIYSWKRYRTLQPKLVFTLENQQKKSDSKELIPIERRFVYNQKIVSSSEVEKHIRNKDNFIIIYGESGMGKTSFIEDVGKNLDLKYGDKLRIKYITKEILNDQVLSKKKVDEILDEYRKQVIILDDAEYYNMQVIQFVQRIYSKEDSRTKPEISFCLATSSQTTKLKLRLNALGVQVIHCTLMPLEIEEIRNYMMKAIVFHNFTDKKNLLEQLLGVQNTAFAQNHPKYTYVNILHNPFYLNIYVSYLNHRQSISDYNSCLMQSFNRYTFLKQAYAICWNRHRNECKETANQFVDCFYDIRKFSFEYYINNFVVTEAVKQIVRKYATNQIIANQLAFYPVNVEAILKKDKDLFIHKEYMHYFLAEAYCYYLENSYRNLSMGKFYSNQQLLALVKQRYGVEKTHSKLLNVVEKSKKYKATWEQASNAMTLLNKISYTFTNFNFDEIQIPQADLTQGVFYNCTMRAANMTNTILYKTQMLNCLVDNAVMDNIGIFEKKYEIDYTVLTAALSIDGRNLALGCGNYLIILQTDTGKELKKIEAQVDIIRSVKYSRDSNTLITIADRTLIMWETRSYRSVVFRLPQKGTIAFCSETDLIASVIKNSLKVWNIKSIANQFTLDGHSDLITCLQFSVDGSNIVTGSRDTTIRVWSTKKGELLRTFKGHSAQVVTLKISPFKKTVVSSSKDRDLVVWGFESAAQISKKRFLDQITVICLDEKQKFVVVAFSKENNISILHIETLDVVHVLQGHKGKIISLNFDSNFRRLISLGRDKVVKIWDFDKIIETEQKKYWQIKRLNLKISKGPILSMAYDKVNQKYITSHENGEINIFSAINNRHIDQLISHNGPVSCVQFDKSGKIYSAGSDGSVRIWALSTRREPKVLDLHSSAIIQLKLNQRNRVIATSSVSQDLVIVDFTGIKIIMSTKEQGKVESIQFNKDEKIMAVGGSEKYIAIYHVGEGGNSINRMEQLGPNSDIVTSMVFHGEIYLVAALKNGHIAIWNHQRATLAKKIENISLVTQLLSFQKKYVCFSSEDGKLRVVDMDEGKQIKVFRLHEKCTGLAVNSNQSLLYESTSTGNIAIWNLGSLKQRQQKVEFDRIAFDEEGLKVVQIEGPRDLLIRDLHFHEQEVTRVKEINYDIEGVTFYKGKIILLLKNGVHWELGKKEFSFGSEQEAEGDLFWLRDKKTSTFFKTPVKKLKGIKKPIQSALQDLFY